MQAYNLLPAPSRYIHGLASWQVSPVKSVAYVVGHNRIREHSASIVA